MGNLAYGLPDATSTKTNVPDIAEQRRQLERNLGLPAHTRPGLLPRVQENIQSGQKTTTPVNDIPVNRNSSINPDNGGSGNLGLKWAFQGGTGGAASPLITEMQGEFQWYTAGIIDRLFGNKSILENSSPSLAQKGFYEAGSGAGVAVKNIPKVIQDSLEKIPDFEIPKIKLPKFDIPELPKFDIPKIPEFNPQPKPEEPVQPGQPKPTVDEPKPQPQPQPKEKDIPRLKEPAPKPIPKSLLEQLQQLELSPCGSISFRVVYATKAIDEYFVPNEEKTGGHFEVIRVPSSLDEIYGLYSSWESTQNIKYYSNASEFLESGGGTGAGNQIDIGDGAKYVYTPLIGNGVYGGGSPYGSGYPFYYAGGGFVEISGDSSKAGISRVLGDLSKGGYTPEIYKLNVSNPSAKDCPIGKPPPPPPPPDPPKDCDCMAQCCPDIDLRQIKALMTEVIKETKLTINVPVVECKQDPQTGKWEAKTTQKSLEVFAASQEQADQIAALHIANAEQATQLCEAKNNDEAVASIPLFW